MMLIRALLLCLFAFPATAAPPLLKYLQGTGGTPCATIQAADAAYCTALGCDGTLTKFWFPIVVLGNGLCAVEVRPGDAYFDVTVTLPHSARFPSGKTVSLTAGQIAALVTRASLAGQLPDTLTLAQFEAILTAQQLTALNNVTQLAHPVVFNDWQAVQATGYVDQKDPQFIELATQGLALGLITQAQFTQFTTPVGAVAGP